MSCLPLRNTIVGRSAAVIGGGPSTIADLERLPNKAYKIAVNDHCNDLLEPDLAIGLDNKAHEKMRYECETIGTKHIVIPHTYEFDLSIPGISIQSAYAAAIVADYMGASTIYLVGIDCYKTNRHYWHESEGKISNIPIDIRRERWAVLQEHLKAELMPFDEDLRDYLTRSCNGQNS